MFACLSVMSMTGIFLSSVGSDIGDEDIVDNDSLVVELLDDDDDDEDEELDRLLLVLELGRFRFDCLSIDDELKRMSMGCQEEYTLNQYPHPLPDDFLLFGDLEYRLSFDDLCRNIFFFSI